MDTQTDKLTARIDQLLAQKEKEQAFRQYVKPGDIVIDNVIYRKVDAGQCCPKCQAKKGKRTSVEGVFRCIKCSSYFGENYTFETPDYAAKSGFLRAMALFGHAWKARKEEKKWIKEI
jgi:ribosomal protein L37AE/L43A